MRTQVPFELVGGSQPLIVVEARFNGSEPVECALDTGASHVVLLPEIGARLGAKLGETREARGAGGPVRVQTASIESAALGDAEVRDLPVLLTGELGRIGEAIGRRIGGTIGFSFLERFRVTVDYERRNLTLCTADEPADPDPARAELPFTLAHASKPLVMVPVQAGELRFRFALDTGASTTVISPEVARRCELAPSAIPSMAGGGAVAAAAAVLPELAIGGVCLARVRVVVAEFLEALSRATGAQVDGVLGTNVLRRFRVTIDYPAKILRFT